MREWQPISTAPKGYKRILGYSDNWGEAFPISWSPNRNENNGAWTFDNGKCALEALSPTHWMPLPENPKD